MDEDEDDNEGWMIAYHQALYFETHKARNDIQQYQTLIQTYCMKT